MFSPGAEGWQRREVAETCWLSLETLTSGLASWEFATLPSPCLLDGQERLRPTEGRATGLHAYCQKLLALGTRGSHTACINPAKAKFESLIGRFSALIWKKQAGGKVWLLHFSKYVKVLQLASSIMKFQNWFGHPKANIPVSEAVRDLGWSFYTLPATKPCIAQISPKWIEGWKSYTFMLLKIVVKCSLLMPE